MGFFTVAGSLFNTATNVTKTVFGLGRTALQVGHTVFGSKIGKIGIGAGVLGVLACTMSQGGLDKNADGFFSSIKETITNALSGGAQVVRNIVNGANKAGDQLMAESGLADAVKEMGVEDNALVHNDTGAEATYEQAEVATPVQEPTADVSAQDDMEISC